MVGRLGNLQWHRFSWENWLFSETIFSAILLDAWFWHCGACVIFSRHGTCIAPLVPVHSRVSAVTRFHVHCRVGASLTPRCRQYIYLSRLVVGLTVLRSTHWWECHSHVQNPTKDKSGSCIPALGFQVASVLFTEGIKQVESRTLLYLTF